MDCGECEVDLHCAYIGYYSTRSTGSGTNGLNLWDTTDGVEDSVSVGLKVCSSVYNSRLLLISMMSLNNRNRLPMPRYLLRKMEKENTIRGNLFNVINGLKICVFTYHRSLVP